MVRPVTVHPPSLIACTRDQSQTACHEYLSGSGHLPKHHAAALNALGRVALRKCELVAAERYLREAAALDPQSHHAAMNLAMLYYAKARWNSAIAEAHRVLRIRADSYRALLLLAAIYEILDEIELANQFHLRVLAIDRISADGWESPHAERERLHDAQQTARCNLKRRQALPKPHGYLLGPVPERSCSPPPKPCGQ